MNREELFFEELNLDILDFEDKLRKSGHEFPFEARIDDPHDEKISGIYHVVSWKQGSEGIWQLFYSKEEILNSSGTRLVEHRPVIRTKAAVRASVVHALPGLQKIAEKRRHPLYVPQANKELTESVMPLKTGRCGSGKEVQSQYWRFQKIGGWVKDAQEIQFAGGVVTAHTIISYLDRLVSDMSNLGAREFQTVYLTDKLGFKAEIAGIHDHIGTIDELNFFFSDCGGDITVDYSPDGIENLLRENTQRNVQLEKVPEYLICRIQKHLLYIVLSLLTQLYKTISDPNHCPDDADYSDRFDDDRDLL